SHGSESMRRGGLHPWPPREHAFEPLGDRQRKAVEPNSSALSMRACDAVAGRHVLTFPQIADIHRQRAHEDVECFPPELEPWGQVLHSPCARFLLRVKLGR